MKHLELNTETLNKDLIFKIREAGRYLHPRPAEKNRQKEILVFLCKNGTVPQRELTRKLKITPPSVSELLRKLEHADLIERVPNEHDRRNINVKLTDLGRAIAKEYDKKSDNYEKKLFSVLDENEKLELLELLDTLLAYWETILEPEPPKPPHMPPHKRGPAGSHHRPPHKPGRPPIEPLDRPEPPHRRPPKDDFPPEPIGIDVEGPETWENFFDVLGSVIEEITVRKRPVPPTEEEEFNEPEFSPEPHSEPPEESPADLEDDLPISPIECPVELEEDTPPIPPEDGELPTETDVDVKATTEDEL